MSTGGHSSMGYENPAFKIRIVAPNDSLQPPRGTKEQMGLSVGDEITVLFKKRNITGKISHIKKARDGKSILFITIVTNSGKKYHVNYTQANVVNLSNGEEQEISSPAVFAESKLLDFKQFHKL